MSNDLFKIFQSRFPENDLSEYKLFINSYSLPQTIVNRTHQHHILPKSFFPEYSNLKLYPNNCAILLVEDHVKAHRILFEAIKCKETAASFQIMYSTMGRIDKDPKALELFLESRKFISQVCSETHRGKVTCRNVHTGEICKIAKELFWSSDEWEHVTKGTANAVLPNGKITRVLINDIRWETGEITTAPIKESTKKALSKANSGKVSVIINGECKKISKKEFDKVNYNTPTSDKVSVRHKINGETFQISKQEFYESDKFEHVTKGTVMVKEGNQWKRIPTEKYQSNKKEYEDTPYFGGIKKGYMFVFDVEKNMSVYIHKDEYWKNKSKYKHSGSKSAQYKEVTCPHCGKSGKENAMNRWHFDKCKKLANKDLII